MAPNEEDGVVRFVDHVDTDGVVRDETVLLLVVPTTGRVNVGFAARPNSAKISSSDFLFVTVRLLIDVAADVGGVTVFPLSYLGSPSYYWMSVEL